MSQTPSASPTPISPTGTRSSRRSVLAGSLGALGALLTQAAVRAPGAAATADPVLLGVENSSPTQTVIKSAHQSPFAASSSAPGPGSPGVFGENTGSGVGIMAQSTGGPAFSGSSTSGPGLDVTSHSNWAIHAVSESATKPAVYSLSLGLNTALMGLCGYVNGANTSPTKTGVYGRAIVGDDVDARGVAGETTNGRGVFGIATGGIGVFGAAAGGEGVHGESTGSNGVTGSTSSGTASGVFGQNTSNGYGVAGTCHAGVGVSGFSNNGIGVVARSDNGIAIQAQGRVVFSTAGLVPIATGKRSASVSPGIDLAAQSKILTTLESNQPGLSIERVNKSASADQFTVILTGPVAPEKSAKVAWFVIG